MTKHKVLSTKKLDASLVQEAKQNGIEIVEKDFITVRPILNKEKWEEIFRVIESKTQYVAFTSSNAVSSLKKYLTDYVSPFD
jgi:uroporphyrinogen-III synthase